MNTSRVAKGWSFVNEAGTFVLQAPDQTRYLYFPLVNEAGMMSAITPLLHGDIKTGQNAFLMPPVSVEDLHNSRSARNFWVYVDGKGAWSATGNSALQIAQTFTGEEAEAVTLEAGFLWHRVTRESSRAGLRAEITNFIPPSEDQVELMQVTLTNISARTLTLAPTAAIPIYGRSADNLRDHRHVTSLLNRITTCTYGVLVRPAMSFDERGHCLNSLSYGVLGSEEDGTPPQSFYPVLEEFSGEGGSLEWPAAVVAPSNHGLVAGQSVEGYEAIGGLCFGTTILGPGRSKSYIVIMSVMQDGADPRKLIEAYGSRSKFEDWLQRNQSYWQSRLETLAFHTGNREFDLWLKWVELQPILRRLFGNSFLPYHDYGRGGRGWRDLWQDCLALSIVEPVQVDQLLLSSYAGVRIDGSNATIIGSRPGEFIADRNNIPRIWMDHGAWPFLTTQFYIDQSGDIDFLLRKQVYFKDQHSNRSRATDEAWQPKDGTFLQTTSGETYYGTVLEHILVQHLTAFFNVGLHNNIKLEDADWNDGMDMAREHGESVAFTALYASNLRELSKLVLDLSRIGVEQVELASELMLLLDSLSEPVDYRSVADKQRRLQAYFSAGRHCVSGIKARLGIRNLSTDLAIKANWLYDHLRTHEWIRNRDGYEWFNSYYDNDGARVEGDHPKGVRMILTGQVFALMGGIATDEQARQIVRSVDHYLFGPAVGGYHLNTNFGQAQLNLGRCFSYAYGTKENGAMFSHMAVMYANALYRRGLVQEGYQVLDRIYQHCQNFPVSRIYPGIPEYIDPRGRGAYPFLTGSASWLLLTLLTEAFGVKGNQGDLALSPKLVRPQFDQNGRASVETLFAGRKLNVIYHNPAILDYGKYQIVSVRVNGKPLPVQAAESGIVLSRKVIEALEDHGTHIIDVQLAER